MLIDKWEASTLPAKRPGYAAEASRALRFAFKKHLKSPAAALTPKAVKAILNAIADDGKKATARLTGAYGRACYGWAIGKDLLAENPFAGIKLDAVGRATACCRTTNSPRFGTRPRGRAPTTRLFAC